MKTYRYLKGYTLDPSYSTLLDTFSVNESLYKIRWEDDLKPGPIGEYIEVIDNDPQSECFYEPIDLNEIEIISNHGMKPSEGCPQFHQQFVYAIAMKVIEDFEDALGRKIIWRTRIERVSGEIEESHIPRLRIYPHAFREPNAYYTPSKVSILFGYFKANRLQQGINVPGGTVFSCLSPDIIAHEMTHAILDSIHPHFVENTNRDVGAFHEAFSDTIALLQRFTNKELLIHQLERTKGDLSNENILGELATQMGQALYSGHKALRSAIGKYDKNGKWKRNKPDPESLAKINQPHARGAIFVASIFDAFIRLYEYKTRDLFRIAQFKAVGTSELTSPDLINRLADEILVISKNLMKICIQALDYLAPVDVTFGDYLRALITADVEIAPSDDFGYRIALIEAFREWGFYADRVNTMSVESLHWNDSETMLEKEFEIDALKSVIDFLRPKVREILALRDRDAIYRKQKEISAILHNIFMNKQKDLSPYLHSYQVQMKTSAAPKVYDYLKHDKWKTFLKKIGLIAGEDVQLTYKDQLIPFAKNPKIQVLNVRPAFRVSREGNRIDQVVVTLVQTLRVKRKNHFLDGLKFRGGCTLIFDLSESSELSYAIVKRLSSERRLKEQLDYQLGLSNNMSFSFIREENPFSKIQFKRLHDHD